MKNKARNWYDIQAKSDKTAEVFIYDVIGKDWFGMGVGAKEFTDDLNSLGDVSDITVRINSPGGNVWDGLAIYNTLKNHKAKIAVQVDGVAASAASFIAMAGDTITMGEGTFMMIHNAMSCVCGNADEIEKTVGMLRKIDSQLTGIYADHTGIEAGDIAKMMSDETWMTAEEAVEKGFADKVGEGMKVAASIDETLFAQYRNVPEALKPKDQASSMTIKIDASDLKEAIATAIAAGIGGQAASQPEETPAASSQIAMRRRRLELL